MATVQQFAAISELRGVSKFMLVQNSGKIVAHNYENPDNIARIINLCGSNFDAVSESRFKYSFIAREENRNIFIFPVGNYYLWVEQEQKLDSRVVLNRIQAFISKIASGR
jgi:hypothetical protein